MPLIADTTFKKLLEKQSAQVSDTTKDSQGTSAGPQKNTQDSLILKPMNKQYILQKLRHLKPELQVKYGVSELALFGSYSRDEQTLESDLDIMVDFNKPVGIEFFDVVYLLKDAGCFEKRN